MAFKKKRPTSGAINRALDTRSRPGPFNTKDGVIGNRSTLPGAKKGGTSSHASYPPGHGGNTPNGKSSAPFSVSYDPLPTQNVPPKLTPFGGRKI